MKDLPESWPPQEPATTIVPVFPLVDTWLYPGRILPLHIFEPRYRQMIEDSLDGPGRLVVGTIVDGHDQSQSGSPPIYGVAGLGEIGRHEKLADGRFNILLAGLCRVRIEEVASDRLYRKVKVEQVIETEPGKDVSSDLMDDLRRAVLSVNEELTEERLHHLPLGPMADLLTALVDVDRPVRQEIFEISDTGTRAQRALDEFEAHPPKPADEDEDAGS